jgi:peptide-methionine (S)-S-oxide reductase
MSINSIVLGGGCFWCTEALFQNISGVQKVVSGYSGGNTKNPNYEEICTGTTGHAEVVQITYDEEQVTLDDLLLLFFKTHDLTTLNQQGADRGTQYRSIILYSTLDQKKSIEQMIDKIKEASIYNNPIVT